MQKPNIVFIFADQWRAQATGYAGDPNVKTPNLDKLAAKSINFVNAVSCCSVCSPYRASLLTGQYPLTHGVILNDVSLDPETGSMAKELKNNGYKTAYIGKWHLDGHGRKNFIPPERRQGFGYWKAMECTHFYLDSAYFSHESDQVQKWDEYDAYAQTKDAVKYIEKNADQGPFFLTLSWGPPHDPLDFIPEEYKNAYPPDSIITRANVPAEMKKQVQNWLSGYYAHCSALDTCLEWLIAALEKNNIAQNTIFVFTSDHGNMLGSQGENKKQRPWDESVCVPFLLHFPGMKNWNPRLIDTPINTPDIMPTLLGLCGIAVPDYVEGKDFSAFLEGGENPTDGTALLSVPHPFGQYSRIRHNGREYRGLRTEQFTYIQDRNGPWLFYDNKNDPCQMQNLVNDKKYENEINILRQILEKKLKEMNDEFLPGMEYVKKWNYQVNEFGTAKNK